ncbi:MAG TPA: hypothetical protein VJU83_11555, partial [Burkholderiales bacterium]|nr:hypothetical protein [Burkholderiales bacterium]
AFAIRCSECVRSGALFERNLSAACGQEHQPEEGEFRMRGAHVLNKYAARDRIFEYAKRRMAFFLAALLA